MVRITITKRLIHGEETKSYNIPFLDLAPIFSLTGHDISVFVACSI